MIENLPKGGLPDEHDPNDFNGGVQLSVLPPVDFSKGSGLQKAPLSDQGSSDACGPHAMTKYHWRLDAQDYSIRDLAARVLLPTYGSRARDLVLALKNQGQDTKDHISDPVPENPTNMRDKMGLNPTSESNHVVADGYILPHYDIDSCAKAILNFKGVLLGLYGENNGWKNLTVPEPPSGVPPLDFQTRPEIWGHFLYAEDFHLHSNPDGTIEKCIITSTSWQGAGVVEHHIRERYFKSGWVFNPWTLIPKEQQIMTKKFIIKDGIKEGILILEGFTGSAVFADNEAHFAELLDANHMDVATTQVITVPQT